MVLKKSKVPLFFFEQGLVALFYWLIVIPPSHLSLPVLLPSPWFCWTADCKGGILWRQQSRLLGRTWRGSWGKGNRSVVLCCWCFTSVIFISAMLHGGAYMVVGSFPKLYLWSVLNCLYALTMNICHHGVAGMSACFHLHKHMRSFYCLWYHRELK